MFMSELNAALPASRGFGWQFTGSIRIAGRGVQTCKDGNDVVELSPHIRKNLLQLMQADFEQTGGELVVERLQFLRKTIDRPG